MGRSVTLCPKPTWPWIPFSASHLLKIMFFLSLSLYGNADGRPDRDSPTMVSPWKPSQVYGDSRYSDMGCSALREKITPEAT